MNWLRPLLPNRISGQIAILIAISLIVFHLVLTAWFFLDHHDHASERSPERLATLIELIAAAAAETRPGLVQDVGKAFPRFELALAGAAADNRAQLDRDKDMAGFAHRLGPGYRLRSIDVLISRLRRKIERDPHDPAIIKTVRSGGYLFAPPVEAA